MDKLECTYSPLQYNNLQYNTFGGFIQVSQWIPELDLTTRDRIVISSGGMLTDKHAAQKLMGEQFPHILGLQSTLHCQSNSFAPITGDAGFFPEAM